MPRILILEDEVLVGLDMSLELQDHGYQCLGPATTIDQAMALINAHDVAFAILDANLDGKSSAPVAERLSQDGTPFVYVSGYEARYVSEHLPEAPLLPKPWRIEELKPLMDPVLHWEETRKGWVQGGT